MLQVHDEKVPIKADENGVMRVGDTRVSLLSVVSRYLQGDGVEEIVQAFPTLSRADVHLVLGYYLRHQDEVDAHLDRERTEGTRIQRELESEFPGIGETLPKAPE